MRKSNAAGRLPGSSINIIVHPGAERLSIRENFGSEGKPIEVPCDPFVTSVLLAALRGGKEFVITEVLVRGVRHPDGPRAVNVELAFPEASEPAPASPRKKSETYMPPPS